MVTHSGLRNGETDGQPDLETRVSQCNMTGGVEFPGKDLDVGGGKTHVTPTAVDSARARHAIVAARAPVAHE